MGNFYDLSDLERIMLTESTIAEKGTLLERWVALKDSEASPWNERAAAAAELLAGIRSVADIGCGTMLLRKYLAPNVRYTPVDVIARDNDTVVIDLNTSILPNLRTEATTALGLIEYLHDVERIISRFSKVCSIFVVSYNCLDQNSCLNNRRRHGWVNDFTRLEIENIFVNCGFKIDKSITLGEQTLWRLSSRTRKRLPSVSSAISWLTYFSIGRQAKQPSHNA